MQLTVSLAARSDIVEVSDTCTVGQLLAEVGDITSLAVGTFDLHMENSLITEADSDMDLGSNYPVCDGGHLQVTLNRRGVARRELGRRNILPGSTGFSRLLLHWAVSHTQTAEDIQLLLDAGADVHYALQVSDRKSVPSLVVGMTPLHAFMLNTRNSMDKLETLLAANPDLQATEKRGNTPYTTAGRFGFLDAMEVLHQHMDDGCSNGRLLAFEGACRTDEPTHAKRVFDWGLDLDAAGPTGVRWAIYNGNAALLRTMACEWGIDISRAEAQHSGCYAAAHKKPHILSLLRELGVDPAGTGANEWECLVMNTVHYAVWSRDLETVQAAVRECPSLVNAPDSKGATPMCLAASRGSTALMEVLREGGAAPPPSAEHGSPLHAAASANKVMSLSLLRSWGPAWWDSLLDAKTGDGETPLVAASVNRSRDAMQFLVDAGANTDGVPKWFLTQGLPVVD